MIKEDQKRACTKGKVVNVSTIFEVQVVEEAIPTRSTLEGGEFMETVEEKVIRVTSKLGPEVNNNLVACLKRNVDVFARDVHNLTEIDSRIVEHHLNLTKGTRPVKHRK